MSKMIARTSRYAGIAGLALVAAGLAQADISMKLGSVDVPAETLSFSMSYSPVYDPVTYMPVEPARSELSAGAVYLTRNFDSASTQILKRVISHESLPVLEVVVTTPAAGPSPASRAVWKFNDAILNNYGTYTGEKSALVENFDISYSTASLTTYTGTSATPSDTITWKSSTPDAAMIGVGE